MDLPTYTNIWRIEKRLYKLYDFRLPQPLSVITLGVFLGVLAFWILLLRIVHLPWDTPWHVVWIVPPWVITFLATRPVIEGKRLTELLLSQIRFLAEARAYTRLTPEHEPAEVRVEVRVWHRDPDLPLPVVAKTRSKTRERGGLRAPAPHAAEPEPLGLAPAPEAEEDRVQDGHALEAVAAPESAAPDPALPEPVDLESAAPEAAEPDERVAAREGNGVEREEAVPEPSRSRPERRMPEPLRLSRKKPRPEEARAEEPAAAPAGERDEHRTEDHAEDRAEEILEADESAALGTAHSTRRGTGRAASRGVSRAAAFDAAPEPEPLPEEPEPLPAEPARFEALEAVEPEPLRGRQPDRTQRPDRPDQRESAPARARSTVRSEGLAESAEAPGAPKRGLGVRILNYFGFALNKTKPQAPDGTAQDGTGGTEGTAQDAPGSVREADGSYTPVTRPTSLERAQQADRARELNDLRQENEEWLRSYRSSEQRASEQRPSEPEFDELYEPGSGDGVLITEADRPRPDKEARRRAEEMMAAPTPAESTAETEAEAEADVAESRPDEGVTNVEAAAGSAREGAPGDAREDATDVGAERDESAHRRLRGRIQGKQVERRLTRERERVAPPEPLQQAQAAGDPATPEEAAEQAAEQGAGRERDRPHAAPWELPEHGGGQDRADGADRIDGADGSGAADGGDGKAANGPVNGVMDSVVDGADGENAFPKSAQDEQIEVLDRHLERLEEQERSEAPVPPKPRFAESEETERRRRRREGWFTEERAERNEKRAEQGPEALTEPVPAQPAPSPESKPDVQLDHGTGEHESFAVTVGAPEAPEGHERHEEPAETGSPVGAASSKPVTELDHGTGDHESFAATAGAGTDAVLESGDASEVPQEAAAPQAAAETRAKPATELDHGTGEHESFAAMAGPSGSSESATVKADDAERPGPSQPTEHAESTEHTEPTGSTVHPGSTGRTAHADGGDGDDGDDRADTAETAKKAEETEQAHADAVERRSETAQEATVERPKPPMQLDHGTGEHESFAATAAPAEEEASGLGTASGQDADGPHESGSHSGEGASVDRVDSARASRGAAAPQRSGFEQPAPEHPDSEQTGLEQAPLAQTDIERVDPDQSVPETATEASADAHHRVDASVSRTDSARPAEASPGEKTSVVRAAEDADARPISDGETARGDEVAVSEQPQAPAPAKPVTELDHGTGEHESFAATAGSGDEPHRATDEELSAAEEAALRARKAASGRAPSAAAGAASTAAPTSAPTSQEAPSGNSPDSPNSRESGEPGEPGEPEGRSGRLSRSMRSNPTGSQLPLRRSSERTTRDGSDAALSDAARANGDAAPAAGGASPVGSEDGSGEPSGAAEPSEAAGSSVDRVAADRPSAARPSSDRATGDGPGADGSDAAGSDSFGSDAALSDAAARATGDAASAGGATPVAAEDGSDKAGETSQAARSIAGRAAADRASADPSASARPASDWPTTEGPNAEGSDAAPSDKPAEASRTVRSIAGRAATDRPSAARPASDGPTGDGPGADGSHAVGSDAASSDAAPSDAARAGGDAAPSAGGATPIGAEDGSGKAPKAPKARKADKSTANRTAADRPPADRPTSADRPPADRPTSADRPTADRPASARRASDRPTPEGSTTGGPTADRPTADGSTADGSGSDDGVFSKVAENARRLNSLFGQEARQDKRASGDAGADAADAADAEVVELGPDGSGTADGTADNEDKPELQLDHGTGEQRRLSPADRARAAAEASGADTGATRGWRRLARVVTGGGTAPKHELPAGDVARLRLDVGGPRSVVVLGCTGGAGQTITALMLGHTLAAYRDGRVVAVDVNPGVNGLSRRIRGQTPETLTSLLANADSVDGYTAMQRYTTQTGTGLEVVSTLDDPYVQTLDDRDYAGLTGLLSDHYEVALLDPAATGVARALPVADGLVLVAPASADAARSVAMTFEWLDGHGYAALRSRSVVVVNGVSKRSLGDVDEAEQVARGRCRAIVRVPWDDHVAQGRLGDTGNLRSSTRRAHAALGGVLVHAMSPAGRQPSNRTPSEARR